MPPTTLNFVGGRIEDATLHTVVYGLEGGGWLCGYSMQAWLAVHWKPGNHQHAVYQPSTQLQHSTIHGDINLIKVTLKSR